MSYKEMIKGLTSKLSVQKEILFNFDLAIQEAKKEVFDDIDKMFNEWDYPEAIHFDEYNQLKNKHLGS